MTKELFQGSTDFLLKRNLKKDALYALLSGRPSGTDTLQKAMRQWGWAINPKGHVTSIQLIHIFEAPYIEDALKSIAPFVKPGSYIYMSDSDDRKWRYYFFDGEMRIEDGAEPVEDQFYTITKEDKNGDCTRIFKSTDVTKVIRSWYANGYSHDEGYFMDIWKHSYKDGVPYSIADIKVYPATDSLMEGSFSEDNN